ncbi:hypothetical protein BJ138DRAFT_844473 [Hygrophoropsis aurantiaca]|uniref:Uncharacterized protein n=1 Tax=Hygrophoropsis aurantiaca TaxID=72124 RepID=A0ACB7ZVR9_9AGAM|nr:hypothetical protein BJ138DRAFT_844473 [Hygrophoropsis aurantiaca]
MADPAFIQELQWRQITNYITAAGGALVAYDQVLTFSEEVIYLWNRQWNFMIALYVIARYSGSLSIIGLAALYMDINWTSSVNVTMLMAVNWAGNIFTLTMQVILMVRVYVLTNKSRAILVFLGIFYVLQATGVIALTALMYNSRVLHEYGISVGPAVGSVEQIVNYNTSANTVRVYSVINQQSPILSVIFDIVLLFFALRAFLKHALEAKRWDGKWSVNVLVRTVMADHLVYFVCNLTWLLLNLILGYISSVAEIKAFTAVLNNFYSVLSALVIVTGPRMVISLRATENRTRRESSGWELSTIQFGVREPPTQSLSGMEVRTLLLVYGIKTRP